MASKMAPGGPKRPPRGSQDAPKRPRRGPKTLSRGIQDAPRSPWDSQEAPKMSQEASKRLPKDIPNDSEGHPRGLWPFCLSSYLPRSSPPLPPPSSPSRTSSSDFSSILPFWGMAASPVLCSSVCSHASLIKATPLGIVADKMTDRSR